MAKQYAEAEITEKKADYLIGLKGNQGTLREDVELYFTDFAAATEKVETKEKGHGRVEKREFFLETDIHWLNQDSAKARKDNSPLNMNILRKTTLSLLKKADLGRIGLRKKMRRAALNLSTLASLLFPKK
jgi:predicted transposase YbfD/YdcC